MKSSTEIYKLSRKTKVFDHFKEVSGNKYECIYCNWKTVRNATRMVIHLRKKCGLCPEEVGKKFNSRIFNSWQPKSEQSEATQDDGYCFDNESHYEIEEDCNDDYVTVHVRPSVPTNVTETSVSVDQHLSSTDRDLDSAFARAIFACSLPLNEIENPHLIGFLQKLQPSWCPPSAEDILTRHLPQQYEAAKQYVIDRSRSVSSLSLRSCRGEYYKMVINSKSEPLLLANLDCTQCSSYDEKVKKIVDFIEEFASDNIEVIIFDDLSCIGDVQTGCVHIKHVKLVGCLATAFANMSEYLGKHPLIEKLESIVSNLNVDGIKTNLLSDSTLMVDRLTKTILNEIRSLSKVNLPPTFWTDTFNLFKVHEAIVESTNLLYSEQFSIGLVCHLFNKIKSPISDFEDKYKGTKNLSTKMQKLAEACISDTHLAANVLDPSRMGADLSASEKMKGMEHIHEVAAATEDVDEDLVMAELALFNSKSGVFNSQFLWKTSSLVSSIVWWNGYFGKDHQISIIAEKILSTKVTLETPLDTVSVALSDEQQVQVDFISANSKFFEEFKFEDVEMSEEECNEVVVKTYGDSNDELVESSND